MRRTMSKVPFRAGLWYSLGGFMIGDSGQFNDAGLLFCGIYFIIMATVMNHTNLLEPKEY